jgi:hypothetical protein
MSQKRNADATLVYSLEDPDATRKEDFRAHHKLDYLTLREYKAKKAKNQMPTYQVDSLYTTMKSIDKQPEMPRKATTTVPTARNKDEIHNIFQQLYENHLQYQSQVVSRSHTPNIGSRKASHVRMTPTKH